MSIHPGKPLLMHPAFPLLVALVAGTLALSGCEGKRPDADFSALRPGMSRQEVEAVLGKPEEVTGLSVKEKTERLEKATHLNLEGVHALNNRNDDLKAVDPNLPAVPAATPETVHYFYRKNGQTVEVIFVNDRLATYGTTGSPDPK